MIFFPQQLPVDLMKNIFYSVAIPIFVLFEPGKFIIPIYERPSNSSSKLQKRRLKSAKHLQHFNQHLIYIFVLT